jgi:hypothetical protein
VVLKGGGRGGRSGGRGGHGGCSGSSVCNRASGASQTPKEHYSLGMMYPPPAAMLVHGILYHSHVISIGPTHVSRRRPSTCKNNLGQKSCPQQVFALGPETVSTTIAFELPPAPLELHPNGEPKPCPQQVCVCMRHVAHHMLPLLLLLLLLLLPPSLSPCCCCCRRCCGVAVAAGAGAAAAAAAAAPG